MFSPDPVCSKGMMLWIERARMVFQSQQKLQTVPYSIEYCLEICFQDIPYLQKIICFSTYYRSHYID